MNIKENIITGFAQDSTGFVISTNDLTTGKVVVNNIEITSIEDWNKVTKSLIELQQENKQLHNKIDKIEKWLKYKAEALDEFDIPKRKETGAFWYKTRGEIDGLLEILKGDVK